MNEYLFYTSEGSTQSPNGNDIENCQLIGISTGADERDALEHLLSDNTWIKENGFNPSKFSCREILPRSNHS